LKSQELTAIFLATRLYCSVVMEYDIHTILDLCTFATTGWVIYMMRFKLKATLMTDLDNLKLYYVVSGGRLCMMHLPILVLLGAIAEGNPHDGPGYPEAVLRGKSRLGFRDAPPDFGLVRWIR
jgi:hypothetical protein